MAADPGARTLPHLRRETQLATWHRATKVMPGGADSNFRAWGEDTIYVDRGKGSHIWDLDGNVLESFAPDFFLPDLDVYVELTTLQQHLVRKKNRKVRRLRELYPAVRIKLFYARDFRALMLSIGADITETE